LTHSPPRLIVKPARLHEALYVLQRTLPRVATHAAACCERAIVLQASASAQHLVNGVRVVRRDGRRRKTETQKRARKQTRGRARTHLDGMTITSPSGTSQLALPSGGTHCARSTVGGSRRPSPTGSGENIQRVVPAERAQRWSRRGAGVGAGERSPGADVGRGEPSPGADVAHRRACPATTVRAVQTLSRARSQRARAQSLR
jgi:hypothetical protein